MEPKLAQFVRERAGERCEYCHVPESAFPVPFQIDHVESRQHGGPTVASNLAWCCIWCNKRKGPNIAARDRTTRRLVPLFNPRRHRWDRHFRWRGAVLLGLTSIGRATIRILAINDPEYVRFRRDFLDGGPSSSMD